MSNPIFVGENVVPPRIAESRRRVGDAHRFDPLRFHGAWVYLCVAVAAGALLGRSYGVERAHAGRDWVRGGIHVCGRDLRAVKSPAASSDHRRSVDAADASRGLVPGRVERFLWGTGQCRGIVARGFGNGASQGISRNQFGHSRDCRVSAGGPGRSAECWVREASKRLCCMGCSGPSSAGGHCVWPAI